MIRVTVELIPLGIGDPKLLGQMDIANDATGTKDRGNYYAKVYRKGTRSVLRLGRVKDYPRLSYNVWRLVLRCLKSAFPEENKTPQLAEPEVGPFGTLLDHTEMSGE